MTNSFKALNKNFNFEKLKEKIINFRKFISGNYLCIEFGYDYIQIAEAYFSKGCINFKKIIRKDIPLEAFDKGVPSEPSAMGNLVSNLIKEEKIFIKRAAIVLSPDSFFTRLIDIPSKIKIKNLFKYLTDPNSLIQIPININNTDFNICKTAYKSKKEANDSYFLIATPKSIVNNLIQTCEEAELELNYIEVGFYSLARLINFQELFDNESENQYLIMLEFLPNCTYFTLLDKESPLMTTRLTSIRSYSLKIGDLSNSNNSEYLPISKLDLKVLVKEIKSALNQFFEKSLEKSKFKVAITGINSLHPNLSEVLSNCINLPVYQYSPSANNLIGEKSFISENFFEDSFNRIFGLGLGLANNSDLNYFSKRINYSLIRSSSKSKSIDLINEDFITIHSKYMKDNSSSFVEQKSKTNTSLNNLTKDDVSEISGKNKTSIISNNSLNMNNDDIENNKDDLSQELFKVDKSKNSDFKSKIDQSKEPNNIKDEDANQNSKKSGDFKMNNDFLN